VRARDPGITGLISDRCYRILHLIHQQGFVPPQEFEALRATLDQWIKYSRKLEAENAELREENEELSTEEDDEDDSYLATRLLRKINRSVSFDFDSLEEAVEFLLES
jgi:predicted  nucleic acid-binding Zn-ribbon protein